MAVRVAIFSNYNGYLKAYSPLMIAEMQLKMLVNNGYKPVFIASDGFHPPKGTVYDAVEIRKIPEVPVHNEVTQDATFQQDIDLLAKRIKEVLKDIDVVLTHDLIYLPDYLKHNIACRKVALELPKLRWLHMIHSASSPTILIQERTFYENEYTQLLQEKFPNSMIIFPNSYDIPRVARHHGFEEDEIKVCPHALEYSAFNKFEPITNRLISKYNLLVKDVICVYPCRLDRGKQPHINIEIMAEIKKLGLSVAMIFADFHSTGGDKVTYRDEMKKLAKEKGLTDEEVIWISEFEPETELEVDKKVISDLFELSNVFILPSRSETYSLVAQEALAKGNFLILNQDFAPFRSIYGDHAIYKSFSSNIGMDGLDGEINTTYGDREAYMRDIAHYINYVLKNDRVIAGKTYIRKKRNMQVVFKSYLEPLIGWRKEEKDV